MSEFFDQSPAAHTYLVAGGGGGMRSTLVLRMLAAELTERKLPFTAIEGIRVEGDEQHVHIPSRQVDDMAADIAKRPTDVPVLFITHCIGTVAGLQTLEKVIHERSAGLVAVAPPLPSPLDTVMTPQSSKKRSAGDRFMRVVDLPPNAIDYSEMTESSAHIHPKYFDDIAAAADLEIRLRRHIEAGTAALFAPEYDWNIQSPRTVRSWHDTWQSDLESPISPDVASRAVVVPNAAHGLYLSPRSGIEITPEADVRFQAQNVSAVVDAGLRLIE